MLVKEVIKHLPIKSLRPMLRSWLVESVDGEYLRIGDVRPEQINLIEQTVELKFLEVEDPQ